MNKHLEYLNGAYEELLSQKKVYIADMKQLCIKRSQVYSSMKSENITVNLDEVLADRNKFLKVPQTALYNISSTYQVYNDIITLITEHYPCQEVLTGAKMIKVLELDEKVLKEILKQFKTRPNAAGAKLRVLKTTLAKISDKKSEIEQSKE